MAKTKNKRSKKQARAKGGRISDKIQAYFNLHAHALFFSLARLLKSPFTSAMTIAVLAIALSLAGGFYLLVANVQQLTGNIKSSNQISVFMKLQINDQQARQTAKGWRARPTIADVEVITKQQALEEFKQYSGFGDALKALKNNPLPVVLQVQPNSSVTDKLALKTLLAELEQHSEVDFAQLDMQWLERLQSMMKLAERGVLLISCLLGVAVLFITGNTIRLELQNRRDEVLIAKLVGATHGFIQRPFLYSGFWYGLLAGIFAWSVITCMMWVLQKPIETLSALYDGNFSVLFLNVQETLALLLIAAGLGIIGAWMVLIGQLQLIKPE